jgi:hypothetical protein
MRQRCPIAESAGGNKGETLYSGGARIIHAPFVPQVPMIPNLKKPKCLNGQRSIRVLTIRWSVGG